MSVRKCACLTGEDCDGACGFHRPGLGRFCGCGCANEPSTLELNTRQRAALAPLLAEIREVEKHAGHLRVSEKGVFPGIYLDLAQWRAIAKEFDK